MGDTDQGPKQIEGIEIAANFPALNRAPNQRINRCTHEPLRAFK